MPHSRPIREVGPRVHELRIRDQNENWRIIYHLSSDAVVILHVFAKQSRRTRKSVLEVCQTRLRSFLDVR